jgi:hypothetical protein
MRKEAHLMSAIGEVRISVGTDSVVFPPAGGAG